MNTTHASALFTLASLACTAGLYYRAWRIQHPKPHGIKVFALDDVEWWAGESLEACVAAGQAACGSDCYAEPDDYAELSDEQLQRMTFVDDDGAIRTFAEELARRVAAGDTFPQPFAASDW